MNVTNQTANGGGTKYLQVAKKNILKKIMVGVRQMLAFCSEINSLKKLGTGKYSMDVIQPAYF